MKIMHTSDWHVGKNMRGHSRLDEHRAVLSEIADIAETEQVDLVLVAGDLFETASPTGEQEQVVYDALLRFARSGADVVVIAGNHDNGRRLKAITPVFAAAEVRVVASPRPPADGGVIELTARTDGAPLRVSALPFVSKRGIVRAEDLMDLAAHETQQVYAERLQRVVAALCAETPADAVNVACTHAFFANGVLGGGERSAHTILDYAISPQSFPTGLHYVAAGHLHRHQTVSGPAPIRYSGSPLQLDFGETHDVKGVVLVEATPGAPARIDFRPLSAGCRLLTVTGSLEQVRAAADEIDPDAWVRVRLDEAPRTGLADEVRAILPRAVEVQTTRRREGSEREGPSRAGKSPIELFGDYLGERGMEDDAVADLFADLYDELEDAS